MAENSAIEWTHHTFNPWRGCTKVSAGCANCYAESLSKRNPATLGVWGDNGTRVVAAESYWKQPIKWNREAEQAGERRRVFCASLADVFEDRPELVASRRRLFKLIQATPFLDWLLLTKRPQDVYRLTYQAIDPTDDPDCDYNIAGEPNGLSVVEFGELFPNIWLGTSVENQEQADKRIPELLKVPAAVRFLSCEPLLGPVNLGFMATSDQLHWVIAGGESGSNARFMRPEWAQSLRDQCKSAGAAFFFKQWGEYLPDSQNPKIGQGAGGVRVGKKAAGRLLDGKLWNEFPEGE